MQFIKQKIKASLTASISIVMLMGGVVSISSAAQLEEIIVTAQKRTQSLTDIPVSITAIQGATLANAGLDSVADLTQMVPALRVDFSGAFMQPTIRGVGSAVAGTGFGTNVATYVDGFYNPNQLSTDSMFINLESVEVLKGPQGTLFGRNATGGAILLKLRDPSFDPALKFKAAYGRFGKREVAFYGSNGLSETLAADISVAYQGSDGFTDNIVTGEKGVDGYDNYAVRTAALWQASDAVSFKLALHYAENEDGRPYATSLDTDATGPSSQGAFFGGIGATKRGEYSGTTEAVFESETKGIYLTTTVDLGFAELTSYTQYREDSNKNAADFDASSFDIFSATFFHDTDTFTQEFNLTGSAGALDYVVGAYYYDSFDSQSPFPTFLGGFGPFDFYDSTSDVQSWSLFVDGTYSLTDKLSLIAGVRYSEEKSKAMFSFGQGIIIASGGAIPQSLLDVPVRFSHDWDDVSGRLGLRYEIDDNSGVYFMYSQGFKAGLLTPNSFDTTPLEPEDIDAYEIGYKYSGDRNRFDVAIFSYDYKDLQVANYVGGSAIYRNAASSTIKGGEFQWTSLIGDGLQVNIGIGYTDAKYDDFDAAPAFSRDLRPTINGIPNSGFGGFQIINTNANGLQLQRTPEWTVNIGAQYERPLANGSLMLSGNFFYTSEFPFDNVELFMEDAYTILNLRAEWTTPDEKWTYGIYGTNVLDEEYRTQVLPQPPSVQQTYGEPRVFGVSVAYSY